jgi:hypothetical protein
MTGYVMVFYDIIEFYFPLILFLRTWLFFITATHPCIDRRYYDKKTAPARPG